MEVLGAGGFNVVFKTDNGKRALRLSGYPSDKQNEYAVRMIKRGHALLRIMNLDYKGLLGPALLQKVTPITTSESIPEDLRQLLQQEAKNGKNTVKELLALDKMAAPKMFYMNKMEMLQTLRFFDVGTYFIQTTFYLCWFLVMAQKRLKFSHRDIKYGNLGARAVPPETKNVFVLVADGEELMFSIEKCPFTPVLFDYDFASLDGITRDTEYPVRVVGTDFIAPPEVFCNALSLAGKKREPDSVEEGHVPGIYFLDSAIDWWSLGVTLFDLHVGMGNGVISNRMLLDAKSKEYAELSGTLWEYLYNIYVLHNWILTDKARLPVIYYERYPKVANKLRIDFSTKKGMINKKNVQYYRAEFQKLPPPIQEFFRKILSLDPEERTFYGHSERYLNALNIFDTLRVQTVPGSFTAVYRSDDGAKKRPDAKQYPAIQQQQQEN